MTTAERELIDMVLQLPPELQDKVHDFAKLLLRKQQSEKAQLTASPTARTLRQDWAGALAHLAQQYDSVALQHKATDWMGEGAPKRVGNDVSR